MNLTQTPISLLTRRLIVIAFALVFAPSCADADSSKERIELIENIMKRGDFGAATLELSNLIQTYPENLDARLLQGKVSLAAGRPATAESQLLRAKNLGADDKDVLIPLGRAILAQGDFERISQALGKRPVSPEDAVAWSIILGTADLHTGNFAQAEKHFVFVLDTDPDNLDGLLGRAKLFIATNDTAAAESIISQVTESHPLSIAAWQALGTMRFSERRYVEAERAFINAVEGIDGINRAEEYMLARVGLIETQWYLDKKSLAYQNTKNLINNYPWHPLPKYLRGLLAFFDGEYDIASANLQRVIDIIPHHQPSLKLMAAITSAQGKLGRAQIYLDRYYKINASDPEIIYLMADTYLRMGNATHTVATLKPLINQSSENADLLDLYATACLYAGDNSTGIRYLRRAVNLDPDNLQRQTRLAAALLNHGDIEEADQLMSSWETHAVTEKSRQILRLERFLRSGQLQRATQYAKKLRRENPFNLHAMLALAEISELAGDRQGAIDWLEIARDRNPTAAEPRILLATLYTIAGQHDLALDLAQESTAVHPYDANILRQLSESQLTLGDVNSALATASEAYRLAQLQDLNLLTLIRAQLAASDYYSARNLIVGFIKNQPENLELIRPYIVEEFGRGNVEQAFDLIDRLKREFPNSPVLAEAEGDLHLLGSEPEKAANAYAQALSLKPSRLLALKATLSSAPSRRDINVVPLEQWIRLNPLDRRAGQILHQLAKP